jgi:hypothetical protein
MRTKIVFVAFVLLVTAALVGYALDLRRSPTYSFTRSIDVPITAAFPGYPCKLDSVVMSFSTPQTAKFELQLRRGPSEAFRTIYAVSNTFTTVTWLLEGTLTLTTNDTLRFTNSVTVAASAYFNYEL